jgi:hypothetical protein
MPLFNRRKSHDHLTSTNRFIVIMLPILIIIGHGYSAIMHLVTFGCCTFVDFFHVGRRYSLRSLLCSVPRAAYWIYKRVAFEPPKYTRVCMLSSRLFVISWRATLAACFDLHQTLLYTGDPSSKRSSEMQKLTPPGTIYRDIYSWINESIPYDATVVISDADNDIKMRVK